MAGSALTCWCSLGSSRATTWWWPTCRRLIRWSPSGGGLDALVQDGFEDLDASGLGSSITATGSTGANVIIGSNGNDSLNGGGGNDTLNGGAGDDTLLGGDGNDIILIGNAADHGGTEVIAGGAGTDAIRFTSTTGGETLSLAAGVTQVESVVIANAAGLTTGTTALNVDASAVTSGVAITGNAGANVLTGTGFDDVLNGGAGNDQLDGGAGKNVLIGGSGNDTFLVNAATDLVSEALNGGTDTVRASLNYTLGANVENLTLTGSALNGTGNTLNNVIIGNDFDNTLTGGAGNDSLNGEAGVDTLVGGAGNDTYTVDNVGDVVTEGPNAGIDTVLSAVTYQLSNNVETLTLTGSSNIDGTGNDLNNILTGNSGINVLTGGKGNDTYVVQNDTDSVVEDPNAGIDLVQSVAANFTLGANVENLMLMGTGDINGVGNGLNNILTGNSGNNLLDGKAGADKMVGGAGNDTYVVENLADIVTETLAGAAGGIDTVVAALNYTLGANLENLSLTGLTGSENLNGTGNTLDNILTGNSGNNLLTGLAGNDTLNGGDGNDILDGGVGIDTLSGGAGDDLLILNTATDIVVENPGEGSDTVRLAYNVTVPTLIDLTSAYGGNVENVQVMGSGVFNLTGNAAANSLTGNASNNILTGGDGNDILDGGGGIDTLSGGNGDDMLVLDRATDIVVENPGEGSDTVRLAYNVTAPTLIDLTSAYGGNVENVQVMGSGVFNLTGNAAVNSLTGNASNNILIGGDGNDRLNGGMGADNLQGGAGDDLILIGAVSEYASAELINGGDGSDILRYTGITAATLTLRATASNVEQVQIASATGDTAGTAAINVNAAAVTNGLTIRGNAGNNVLTGTVHADTISGGAGADSLIGGNGDDIFNLAPGDYLAGEVVNGGSGINTLRLTGSGQTLDLTAISNAAFVDVEILDLSEGDNTLTLSSQDVLAMNGGATIRIDGDANDEVTTSEISWIQGTDVTIGPNTYAQYTNNGATLLVDTDMAFSIVIPLSSLSGTNGFKLAGAIVAGDGGDVNGDGFSDVVGGNYLTYLGSETSGFPSGRGSVLFGHSEPFPGTVQTAALNGANGVLLNGSEGSYAGGSINSAGDINGDGFSDIIIGAAGNGYIQGVAYVVFGKAGTFVPNFVTLSNLNGSDGFRLSDPSGTALGASVESAGDFNGDGMDDLIVGDPYAIPHGPYSGSAYVLFGRTTGFPADVSLSGLNGTNGVRLDGGEPHLLAGTGVSCAGDVNGDGIDDVLVAPYYLSPTAGAGYLVFGKTSGFSSSLNLLTLDGSDGFRFTGVPGIGFSTPIILDSAGDMNGDGYSDIVVGAPEVDSNGDNAGAVYVVFGKAGGFSASVDLSALDGTNGFELFGPMAGANAGSKVSSAGDFNGDGFDDLVVTGPVFGAEKLTYLVFGHSGPFASSTNLATLGSTEGLRINAVGQCSSAGDVNGDGLGDIMVGTEEIQFDSELNNSHIIFGYTGNSAKVGGSGNDVVNGDAGPNIMVGGQGNDQLNGGPGNDILRGGLGSDTYQVNRGDGQDLIFELGSAPGDSDTLLYGATINPLDLVLSRQVNDLRIALHGTTDSVTIDNWYADPTVAQVETIQVGNGQTLLSSQVDQLIQAMAQFTQQTGLTWDQGIDQRPQEVQAVLAGSWQ